VLGYSDYQNFELVINKAHTARLNSGQRIDNHIVDVTDMIEVGKGAKREVKTVFYALRTQLGWTHFQHNTSIAPLVRNEACQPETQQICKDSIALCINT
jgi:hypothetical protein